MKINKLILAIFIAASTVFVACEKYEDTVTPGPAVAEGNPAIRFAGENITEYELEPSVTSIELTVIRNGSESAIEVPITVIENTANSFDVPATLSFPAGEDTVTLVLPIITANAPLGDLIKIAIEFGDEFSNPYKIEYSQFYGEVTILNWQPFATGTYYSQIFDSSWEQVLYRAQGTNKYRFFDLYATGYHFTFVWTGGVAITPVGAKDASGYYIFMPGVPHPTYGEITVHVDSDKAYTFYDAETDAFQFEGKWTVSAGSLGWKDDTYTITERY